MRTCQKPFVQTVPEVKEGKITASVRMTTDFDFNRDFRDSEYDGETCLRYHALNTLKESVGDWLLQTAFSCCGSLFDRGAVLDVQVTDEQEKAYQVWRRAKLAAEKAEKEAELAKKKAQVKKLQAELRGGK